MDQPLKNKEEKIFLLNLSLKINADRKDTYTKTA